MKAKKLPWQSTAPLTDGARWQRASQTSYLELNARHNIQYASEEIWTSKSSPPVVLPPPITTLFDDWRTPSSLSFCIFQKYDRNIRDICTSEKLQDGNQFFLHKPSLDRCKDSIPTESARRTELIIRQRFARPT